MDKLTSHFQWTRLKHHCVTNTSHLTLKMTSAQERSVTNRTTLTQAITLYPSVMIISLFSVADYIEPYVIGLLPRYVEIRTISPRALIQSIELPKPRFITQGKHMYVASTSHVWRLIPVSIPMQIQQLLHDKQFSLALMLAVSHQLFLELYTFTLQPFSTMCEL